MAENVNFPHQSYFRIIEEQIEALAQYYQFQDSISITLKKVYHLLCRDSLSGKTKLPYNGLSRINSNGIPFQWSFSFSANYTESLRFICEAGEPNTSCHDRFLLSLELIQNLNSLLGIPKKNWLIEKVLPILIPPYAEWPQKWRSALWFAVGANKKGILYKVYLNLNGGEIRQRWMKIGRLLTILNRLKSLDEWCSISSKVSENSIPVGIALDILPDGECGRVKVYFRSEEVTLSWLAKWYKATASEHIEATIRSLIESYPLTGSGIYPNQSFFVSWEAGTDEKATLKTELAVSILDFTEQSTIQRTYALMNKLELPFWEYQKLLDLIGYSEPHLLHEKAHKFVGIGFENDGSYHMNTYLQPMLTSYEHKSVVLENCACRKTIINNALNKAKRALFNSMTENKRWLDYYLPVGQSDIWVTAYILFQLQNLSLTVEQSLLYKNAKKWLLNQATSQGWGYNSSTPPDSDSTSLALLSLNLTNKKAKSFLNKINLNCKSENGYSTYNPNIYKGSWVEAVDDVSPYVLLARHKYNRDSSTELPDFIRNNQLENGSWSSYWWTSDLYATYGYLLYFNKIGTEPSNSAELLHYIENYQPICDFDSALLVNCLYFLGSKKNNFKLISQLINQQQENGLWKGSALLRLPKEDLVKPKNKIEGTVLYKDMNGYFTTALTINALNHYSLNLRASGNIVRIL